MHLFRALNDFDMECISKYSIISCNLFRSYLDVSTKEEAKKIMTELVSTNITTSLDRIIGHVNGKALNYSCWISTSDDLLFTLKEYAIPQSGTYNIDLYRKNVAILEFDKSDKINLASLDFKDKDEYKKMYSKTLDLTNNKLDDYFNQGLIKPLSTNEDSFKVSIDSWCKSHDPELELSLHGISGFASKAGENVVYYRINKDKIKRVLTPLDQDIIYAIFIDLIRKDKKEERNLSKIEEHNYMLLALNEYLDKYANIDNDIYISNYGFSKTEMAMIENLYKVDANGHYNALINNVVGDCKNIDAVKYYEHLKNIKRNIISKITGLDNVMLLDDDIAVLNEKLYQEKKALLNDATFKKYLNDVIYYQDSNYLIISGNELKKGLTKKKKS
ncbi:unknown [Coprobacillus sp. CAG:605]|nr:unknown [Coprobacillus sp. CAG:605]